jgi:sulfotransferase family protein
VTRTIWLASYPKSGNTWFRMLVANLSAKDGKPVDINALPERGGIASSRGPFDHLLLIDSGLLTHDEIDCLRPRVYEELARGADDDEHDAPQHAPTVRFVKVHDAYTLTPKGEPLLAGRPGADGAILIVRDPRDVAPSVANHNRSNIDTAISFMNDADAGFCTRTNRQHSQHRQKLSGWSAHVASWLDQADIPVHLIRYEDMQVDTIGTFRRAFDFAGRAADDEDIRRAVGYADFAELQRQEQEKGFSEKPPRSGGLFFRRGEVGVWRDELTAEQVARIEAAHAPMMRRLGYEPAGALSSLAPLSARGRGTMRSMVEGACGNEARLTADAPSTALPRFRAEGRNRNSS